LTCFQRKRPDSLDLGNLQRERVTDRNLGGGHAGDDTGSNVIEMPRHLLTDRR